MNNEGWGLSTMITFLFILFFGLTVSMVIYNKNFNEEKLNINEQTDVDESTKATSIKNIVKETTSNNDEEVIVETDYESTEEYIKLEKKLTKAATDYFNNLNTGKLDYKMIIGYNTLKNKGYIDNINDPKSNHECNGYAVYNNGDITSYIKCIGTYQTDNYNKTFE